MTAQPPVDWEKQAKFWQMKYFELLGHTNSVIAALARPVVQSIAPQSPLAQAVDAGGGK